jgi:hypothetical protein
MAQQPSRPIGDSISQPYRVLVTVRPDSRPRDFIWQIVCDTAGGGLLVRSASTLTFKTMNEADNAGTAELSRLPQP